jgi:hypothetical protein
LSITESIPGEDWTIPDVGWIPAYLRDLFGTMQVGAIHGRLITAWSMAAVLGPQLVNYISTYQIEQGVPKTEAYNSTMYLMAGLLLLGLVCNLLVRPVAARHHYLDPAQAATPPVPTS